MKQLQLNNPGPWSIIDHHYPGFKGDMSSEGTRSEQVVEAYKKHKLSASAMRRIHELIHGFDEDKASDRRLALIGVVLLAVLLAVAYFWSGSGESITLP